MYNLNHINKIQHTFYNRDLLFARCNFLISLPVLSLSITLFLSPHREVLNQRTAPSCKPRSSYDVCPVQKVTHALHKLGDVSIFFLTSSHGDFFYFSYFTQISLILYVIVICWVD